MDSKTPSENGASSINKKTKDHTENIADLQKAGKTFIKQPSQEIDSTDHKLGLSEEMSNQFESMTITTPIPGQPHSPNNHDIEHNQFTEIKSTISPIKVGLTPRASAIEIHTTSTTRSSHVNNLVTKIAGDRTVIHPDEQDVMEQLYAIQSLDNNDNQNSPSDVPDVIKKLHATQSSDNKDNQNSSKNKHDADSPYVPDIIEQFKAQFQPLDNKDDQDSSNNKQDDSSSTFASSREKMAVEKEQSMSTKKNNQPVITAMINQKQRSCFNKVVTYTQYITIISGFICIGFGLCCLLNNQDSLVGWVLIGAPIAYFIIMLLLRCCLKKEKDDIVLSEGHQDAIDNDQSKANQTIIVK